LKVYKKIIIFTTQKPQNKHIIFVDNESERDSLKLEEYFQTPIEFLDQSFRPKTEQLSDPKLISVQNGFNGGEINKGYKELSERMQREEKIDKLRQNLQTKKNLMSKTPRKRCKNNGEGLPVYRWKRQRLR